MADSYRSYLTFLESLRQNVEKLTVLAGRKTEAVLRDDLLAMNEILNQEQAMALAFRGMEQTREKLLTELGAQDVPLSELPARCPPELRPEAERAVRALQEQYQAYRHSAGRARELLESTLVELDRQIVGMGGTLPEEGPGYQAPASTEPPPTMKTDFRA